MTPILPQNFIRGRWAGYGLALGFFLLVSLGLNYYYLWGGYQADDILFVNMLRQDPLPFSRWLGAWSVSVDRFPGFTDLWWFEQGVQGSFFRPLPSLAFEGFYRLFGVNALPLHLLSILLHGLAAFTLFRFFALLTKQTTIAFLTGVIFVACEDHSMSVGWISTMTDLMCVVFTNQALIFHLGWREEGKKLPLTLSLICLVLSLACKESAVVAPVAIILLEVFLTRSEQGNTLNEAGSASTYRSYRAALLSSSRKWGPGAGVIIAYLILYKSLGMGGMRSLLYIDPLSQPFAYLRHAIIALPVMFAAALTLIPPSLTMLTPASLSFLAILGGALFILLLWGIKPLLSSPAIGWSLTLCVLSLLPQVATAPSERLLYFPFAPFSFLLASLMASTPIVARQIRPGQPRMPRITWLWGWYALFGLFLPGVVLAAYMPYSYRPSLRKPERDILTGLPVVRAYVSRRPLETVILLNTSGPFLTFYAGGIYEYHLHQPVPTRVLSSLNGKVTIERTGPQSFLLRTDRPGWLSNMFARIARFNPSLEADRVYRNPLFDATLIRLTPDEKDALEVRFDFNRPLDDPTLLFLTWDGGHFIQLDTASLKPGQPRFLADTSDILKSM